MGLFSALRDRGFKFRISIPLGPRRPWFRREPRPGEKVVAQTEPNPWMPKEPPMPPDWWPPEKEDR